MYQIFYLYINKLQIILCFYFPHLKYFYSNIKNLKSGNGFYVVFVIAAQDTRLFKVNALASGVSWFTCMSAAKHCIHEPNFLVICIKLWWNKVKYLRIACVWWSPNQRLKLCPIYKGVRRTCSHVCSMSEEYCRSGIARLSILGVSCIELLS